MPNNFQELCLLLEATPQEHRTALGEIIEAPFGNSPSLLCDHLCFLRAGAIGQLFDRRDYKQLVTDVADRVKIDWEPLVSKTSWAALSAERIEAAIVDRVHPDKMHTDDTQTHVPKPIDFVLKSVLIQLVINQAPVIIIFGPVIDTALNHVFSLLSTDWRKLLATVIYVHQIIRPTAKLLLT